MTVEDLRRDLAAGATGVQAWVLARGIELGLDAERRAKLNATTRPRVRTGALRRSIKGTAAATRDGAIEVRLTAGRGVLGAAALSYAIIQEEGGYGDIPTGSTTRAGVPRSPAGPTRRGRVPATWFARRAITATVADAPRILGPMLSDILGQRHLPLGRS